MAAAATNRPLKIGLAIDTSLDTSEGVPQYVLTLGAWLTGQGHDVHYLAGESKRQDLVNLHSLARNIRVRFNGTATTIPLPASRRRLHQFMYEQQFDVLHVQTPHHPYMAQRLIMAAGPHTAVLASFHSLPYNWLSRWGARSLRWLLRPSLKRIDQMLAVSPAAARFEEWAFGLPALVSPNMIDYQRFHAAKPLPGYQKGLTVLFLGRLEPRKGCATLLEAVAMLRQQSDTPDFRVVVCGKGYLQPQLEQYCRDHGLTDMVEFAGFVSEADKPCYYASADVAVFPSNSGEAFGIVLIEAMASGQAAVLAGDNPGYRSVMEAKPELLFDPNSPTRLADLLHTYLADTKRRQTAASWGATESQQYDTDQVGQALVKHYQEVLRKRRNQ
ncbi:MAG TPA: glycosyltransferase family 4 protein [Candidatus Saccharimonadales bacterium]|nr:glycosyltransferase family 4 protein [Candidatus Saccharimonadales bacterium]